MTGRKKYLYIPKSLKMVKLLEQQPHILHSFGVK